MVYTHAHIVILTGLSGFKNVYPLWKEWWRGERVGGEGLDSGFDQTALLTWVEFSNNKEKRKNILVT